MLVFIFIVIPLICFLIILAMCCGGGVGTSKPKGTYVYIHDEDGEIVASCKASMQTIQL